MVEKLNDTRIDQKQPPLLFNGRSCKKIAILAHRSSVLQFCEAFLLCIFAYSVSWQYVALPFTNSPLHGLFLPKKVSFMRGILVILDVDMLKDFHAVYGTFLKVNEVSGSWAKIIRILLPSLKKSFSCLKFISDSV